MPCAYKFNRNVKRYGLPGSINPNRPLQLQRQQSRRDAGARKT